MFASEYFRDIILVYLIVFSIIPFLCLIILAFKWRSLAKDKKESELKEEKFKSHIKQFSNDNVFDLLYQSSIEAERIMGISVGSRGLYYAKLISCYTDKLQQQQLNERTFFLNTMLSYFNTAAKEAGLKGNTTYDHIASQDLWAVIETRYLNKMKST